MRVTLCHLTFYCLQNNGKELCHWEYLGLEARLCGVVLQGGVTVIFPVAPMAMYEWHDVIVTGLWGAEPDISGNILYDIGLTSSKHAIIY